MSIQNGTFTAINGESPLYPHWGWADSTYVDLGWLSVDGDNNRWNYNPTNQRVWADNTGSTSLIQVIGDQNQTQGLQNISFDAVNSDSDNNNELRLQVYGINGEFELSHYGLNDPTSLDGSPITVETLLDSNNLGTSNFNWKTFNWNNIDFGSGYEYLVVRLFTRGVSGSDFQAADNVSITEGQNAAPIAENDQAITSKNRAITILKEDLLANDSDPDGDSISITSVQNSVNGSAVLDSDGNIIFTPTEGFSGAASFDYTISDDYQEVDTATVTVQVDSTINAVQNGDFAADFYPHWGWADSTYADLGWLSVEGNNNRWNYSQTNERISADDTGSTSLIQVIGDLNQTQGLQNISFDAVNSDSDNNNELRLQVYGVDGEFELSHYGLNAPTSLDGSPINVETLFDSNNLGTSNFNWKTFNWNNIDFGSGYEYLVVNLFTRGVSGSDFQAVDNVVITPGQNTPPIAVDDQALTSKNRAITILKEDLLANDSDPDGDPISITSVQNSVNGSAVLDSDGNIIFTPTEGFSGEASFDYTISDGNQGVDTATVMVQVDSTINAVQNGDFASGLYPHWGLADSTYADLGWLSVEGNNNRWNYDPTNERVSADDTGSTSLIQVIGDLNQTQGLQNISFDTKNVGSGNELRLQVYGINGEFEVSHYGSNEPTSLNGSPINVVELFDTDDQNEDLSTGNNWETFTWNNIDFDSGYEYLMVRLFTRGVSGSDFQAVDNVVITPGQNAAPIAVDDQVTASKNRWVKISKEDLLGNDSDPDGDSLTITSVQNGVGGSAVLDSDGNIIFTPTDGFSGTASFEYTVGDTVRAVYQKFSTATVTVEVDPITNAVKNETFTSGFNEDWQDRGSINADQGWLNANNNKWNYDPTNQWAYADDWGAGGLIQVIGDQERAKGLQNISFDATNWGSNNTLRLQVYGINGEFTIRNWDTEIPVSADGSPITVETLLDTGNIFNPENVNDPNDIADDDLDWKTFSWKDIDFGNGYEYLALRFWTEKVEDSEFQAIDNVIIGSLPDNPKNPPKANDDNFVTQQNQSLTILGTELLSNDENINGDTPIIIGVDQASYGSVSLNQQGNVVFTPNADFAGVTSFDYTIRNAQGLEDKATVTVNVAHPVALGTNFSAVERWSTQFPFLDSFRSADEWTLLGSNGSLTFDENGWVTSIPGSSDPNATSRAHTKLHTGAGGHYQGGTYVVLYDGEGEMRYWNDAQLVSSSPGRDVIEVTPSDNGIYLNIVETDPNQTGEYIRNIRVIPEAYESTYQTQMFNPLFIEKTQPYHSMRFMTWMETNNSAQGEWSERPTLDDYTWSTDKGVPVEVMVELANTLDVDPWFNMPHQVTDEYVTEFATYVRDNLDPELNVYVEYSNEVWNTIYDQRAWFEQQDANDPTTTSLMNWYGKRFTEITQIWDQVFDVTGEKDQVIGVMAGHSRSIPDLREALNYDTWSDGTKTHADFGIDAIAVAPYFGLYIAFQENEAEVETWTVDQIFEEITQGGLLANSPEGGALREAYDAIDQSALLAQEVNLPLLAYEGGQLLGGYVPQAVQDNQALTDLFIEANRDPRMGQIYEEYFAYWYKQGGGLFNHFVDVREAGISNVGALEYLGQQSSPKYDVLMDLINTGTVQ